MQELQPEASNRAIAEAIGVSEGTVRNDQREPAQDYATVPELEPDSAPSDAQDYAHELAEANDEEGGEAVEDDGSSPQPHAALLSCRSRVYSSHRQKSPRKRPPL
jgi:hypothetical protein